MRVIQVASAFLMLIFYRIKLKWAKPSLPLARGPVLK